MGSKGRLRRVFFFFGGVGFGGYAASKLAFPHKIIGRSMEPTFKEGDTVFSREWGKSIKKGNVVIFQEPPDRRYLIKRIIAVGGETVTHRKTNIPIYVPQGHLWMEGDNPLVSCDSNTYGPVPTSNVVSTVNWVNLFRAISPAPQGTDRRLYKPIHQISSPKPEVFPESVQ